MKIIILYIFLISITVSCEKELNTGLNPVRTGTTEILTDTVYINDSIKSPFINQGIFGYVIEWSGDFIPGPETSTGTIDTVRNWIYIYDKLSIDSVKKAIDKSDSRVFYINSIYQKPLKIIKPNKNGFYQIELNTGIYSGLIKLDDQRLFCSGFNNLAVLNPILIDSLKISPLNFNIEINKHQ